MFKKALILPVTIAACKWSYSAKRRIKTWLRFSMEQSRFDNLALLNIKTRLINHIHKEKILDHFKITSQV